MKFVINVNRKIKFVQKNRRRDVFNQKRKIGEFLMQNKIKFLIFFSVFFMSISVNLLANNVRNSNNSENIFFDNNFIPSYVSSMFMRLPKIGKFRSDNFYSSPNSLFFLMISHLSKNITRNLIAYKNSDVEIKIYSLVDRLQSEIFPYSKKTVTKGLVIAHNEKLIGIFCINQNIISSVNGKDFISTDISEENLERFFRKHKSIELTKRDIYLKKKSENPENILNEMILNFNAKEFDNFYSCFSLKYKLNCLVDNFLNKNSFNYDPNQTFFGDIKNIKNLNIIEIENIVNNTDFTSVLEYKITVVVTNNNDEKFEQKCLAILNYSQNFGYRISELKGVN